MIYQRLIRPLLYRVDPERIHEVVLGAMSAAQAVPGLPAAMRALVAPRDPRLVTEVLGLTLPSPVGLAAGFDKDARAYEILGALGFGFVEVGTLTGQPQPGNPRPRLFRLPDDRALVNRMGFNSGGAEAAKPRLARVRRTIVGVNIGKTKVVPNERAVDDYRHSTHLLTPHADYLVVNVSSPNTPGLRDLQAVESLRPLLDAVRREAEEAAPERRVPLLVKLAPDLADDDLDAVADLALELGLDGIIATNTTVSRADLRSRPDQVAECGLGGLSGAPLAARSLAVLRRLRARVGQRLVLVSVGGIETAEDAWVRIRAGASLVQAYTGFIYQGPLFARSLGRGLARLASRDGFTLVQDAVGSSAAAKS
ncbi:quinone-dependent dihydroorotate dehydrogenase [Haliangium sp.]|uniref:quinone-dependent dihydroorotate dehydrogenase n=1 Tax=Haliangium sp. TaxID=2663208 RepID=UPI003D0A5A45